MQRLNTGMTKVFGHRWSAKVGTESLEGWHEILCTAALTANEMANGLNSAIARMGQPGGYWPPDSPAEFIQLARPATERAQAKVAAHRPYVSTLPPPERVSRKDKGRARLAEIKAMLASGKGRGLRVVGDDE